MSDGFSVLPEALERASMAGEEAVAGVRGVDGRGPLEVVIGAMPGSATANSASIAAVGMEIVLTGWADETARYSATLAAAARTFRDAEQHVTATESGAIPPPGRPAPGAEGH